MNAKQIPITLVCIALCVCFLCADQTSGQITRLTNAKGWQGVWRENTNGWITLLNMSDSWLTVKMGSRVRNSDGCFLTPNGKFAKFELLNTNGTVLQPRKCAGTNLLSFISTGLIYPTNQPAWASPSPGTLVAHFPRTTSTNIFPRYRILFPNNQYRVGDIACLIGFTSNEPPQRIAHFNLNEEYSITNEGDYTLIVQPVIYSRHIGYTTLSRRQLRELLNKAGLHMAYYEKNGIIYAETNVGARILYRRDLPCIKTKVHLVPNKRAGS